MLYKKIIILLITIFLFMLIIAIIQYGNEYFSNIPQNIRCNTCNTCNTCDYKSKLECSSCKNCGYCYKNNEVDSYGNCVVGDMNGPYFENDCSKWEYAGNILLSQSSPYYYPTSHYQYNEPSYRHYRGQNNGRRMNHHNN